MQNTKRHSSTFVAKRILPPDGVKITGKGPVVDDQKSLESFRPDRPLKKKEIHTDSIELFSPKNSTNANKSQKTTANVATKAIMSRSSARHIEIRHKNRTRSRPIT